MIVFLLACAAGHVEEISFRVGMEGAERNWVMGS